ncbi:hypothetical protein ACLBUU_21565, partial [Pseudomonas aeruginosa]
MIDPLKHRFAALRSRAEFHSLRYVQRSGEYLSVRRNVSEPPHFSQDRGARNSLLPGFPARPAASRA